MKIFTLTVVLLMQLSIIAQNNFPERTSNSFDPQFYPFYHGVASGDALSDRVIIWTRVTPDVFPDSAEVMWFVSEDTLCDNLIAQGSVYTSEERDYTVKIDVTGLQSNTYYYYYFSYEGIKSVMGRTKTTPTENTDSLRFAVVSGSNYNSGYFNVYRSIKERNDFDAVIHLGDYIYEYGTNEYGDNPSRALEPNNEIVSLADYRMRYSHYRLDPDLRELHQQYPWYVIWDDHETANNSYTQGAENHDSLTEGNWQDRKSYGEQAFFEWIPIREINDSINKIHRTVELGDLASIYFLDTRLEHRDKQDGLSNDDPNKRIIGDEQFNWLKQELIDAQYTDNIKWKIIAQQVMFAPLNLAVYENDDQWDGYQFERQRILNTISGFSIKNTVILTGDIHTSWANDVPDPNLGQYGSNGQGSGTVEFVTPSVTSPSVDFGGSVGSSLIYSLNPHMKFVDLENRGYYILDINNNRTQADWFFVDDISTRNFNENFETAYYVNENESFLNHSSVPSYRFPPYQYFAPNFPCNTTSNIVEQKTLSVMSVSPVPANDYINIQYYSNDNNKLVFSVFDMNSKLLIQENVLPQGKQINYKQINISKLNKGMYILEIHNSSKLFTHKIIKE